jgi:hypothetical protein
MLVSGTIPAIIFETASWQIDMLAKTMYVFSSSSDDEELLDSCASKCLLLQELSVREYQVHPVNVDRNNFREYHHLYKKLRNYLSRFFKY